MHVKTDKTRVIVLGIDAMDYTIAKELINAGQLPNLSRLASNGNFSPLATTNPAESVVAWSSFATGLSPANHGIFDFVMRNPNDYSLYLSLNEINNLGRNPVIKLYRKGNTLWNMLSENNIESFFYFCPNTFPPDNLKGVMVSGMGTPDILGNTGSFTFYTSRQLTDNDSTSRGKIIHVEIKQGTVNTEVPGPRFSKKNFEGIIRIPLKATLSADKQEARLNFQGQDILLKAKQWSQWHKVSFAVSPMRTLRGILKFYLKSVSPEFELYVSPINFDPFEPPFSISYPKNYSKKLASKIGLYYTRGTPHDTWALSEGRIDEAAFLEHVDDIFEDREKILNEGLKEFKNGLFFFYFDTLDIVQHMFWRYTDPQHPLYEKNSPYKNTILNYYKRIDTLVGEVLKNTDEKTLFILISDHGFNSFRKTVHLNYWLMQNGYLSLKETSGQTVDFLDGIDWPRTKAYAIGFGGIYLNKAGREADGIVTEAESKHLIAEIKNGLLKIKDAKNQPAINHVYTQESFAGRYAEDAPDLFVGFSKGFRASWRTAVGGVPDKLMEDNNKKWSGDHLIDPVLVPGVIFINRKIKLQDPAIVDLTPMLLHIFGLDKPNNQNVNSGR